MNNPFDIIAYWLKKESLTASEKREMRTRLMNYATTHPVKSGLVSPYAFRYAMIAFASLVIVLGGSIGVTSASMRALPNQPLYGVKLWVEEFKAGSQKTPEARIAFESARIETRFNEATTLAVNHQLDDSASQIIQSGLEHSREAVKTAAESIQEQNPELALSATNNLETAFSSHGKILATIEKNTDQNIGPIVLAAQVTTQNLALEKVKYEKIVLLKPNADTKAATEAKLVDITAKLGTLSAADANASAQILPPNNPSVSASATGTVSPTSATTAGTADDSSATTVIPPDPTVPQTTIPSALVEDAKKKIVQGSYSQALVTLQKAEQAIDESKLTKSLETTYNIKTVTNASASATTPPAIPSQ